MGKLYMFLKKLQISGLYIFTLDLNLLKDLSMLVIIIVHLLISIDLPNFQFRLFKLLCK